MASVATGAPTAGGMPSMSTVVAGSVPHVKQTSYLFSEVVPDLGPTQVNGRIDLDLVPGQVHVTVAHWLLGDPDRVPAIEPTLRDAGVDDARLIRLCRDVCLVQLMKKGWYPSTVRFWREARERKRLHDDETNKLTLVFDKAAFKEGPPSA